jgi:hypothetical protein
MKNIPRENILQPTPPKKFYLSAYGVVWKFICSNADGQRTQYILYRCTVFEQHRPFRSNTDPTDDLVSAIPHKMAPVSRTFSFSNYCHNIGP